MSYKYGLNGNDLDWDSMEFLKSYCPACDEFYETHIDIVAVDQVEPVDFECANCEHEHINKIAFERDGNYYCKDCVVNFDYYSCDGHNIYYTNMGKGDFNMWFNDEHELKDSQFVLCHHTNSNFVSTYGNVPDDYYMASYINDRNEAEGEVD